MVKMASFCGRAYLFGRKAGVLETVLGKRSLSKMRTFLKSIGILALLLLTPLSASAADYAYSVIKMGDFSPLGINNTGQVIGADSSVGQQAILYDHGEIIKLGTLDQERSYPLGINDDGQVVGFVYTPGSGTTANGIRAFLYSESKMIDLNALVDPESGLVLNEAQAINNHGEIVGICSTTTESKHIFSCKNGKVNDLGIQGDNNGVSSINDGGQFVGSFINDKGYYTGYIMNGGVRTDIISPTGLDITAGAINASGQIIGDYTSSSGHSHAYLLSGGTFIDLEPEGVISFSFGMNDLGQVVGNAFQNHAFLYSDGAMQDLNALIDPELGINLIGASGINNSGQIIAMGEDSSFHAHAYLLTPIPEPTAFIQLLAGICGLIFYYNFTRFCKRTHS
jgi:probable HAF family extracellular repeat protein